MPNHLARANRKRMTDAEMRLWYCLRPMRQRGLAFRRQSPLGTYVVDFECRKAKLCVEVDGGQHSMADTLKYDAERTAWLNKQGYEVLRFSNQDVLQKTDEVVDHILSVAAQRAKTS
jgi:very-short-patch-repair endonuclease